MHYKAKYPQIKDPIMAEMFLLLMGGCDFHNKIFPGIGWKFTAKEFMDNLNKYVRMFGACIISMDLPILEPNGFDERIQKMNHKILQIVPSEFEKFARAVFRRKSKTRDFLTDQNSKMRRMVIPRNIMHTLANIEYVPLIRAEYGVSIVIDPYTPKDFWGYTQVPISNISERLACKPSIMVKI
jgi:hypothetical protein